MLINITRAAILAVAMTMPVAMQAQRAGGPGRAGGNPIAPLIEMRRALNLSSRQLVQLDSIERALIQRNQGLREQLRARLDSVRLRTRDTGEAEIQRLRAEGDSARALRQVIVRNDSTARAAAMNLLTDAQRGQVRERLAERRGFEAGRRSMMRGGVRGFRGRQGGPDGFGPRMRQGPGGRMGRGGMGIRPPRGGMRGPDGFAPRQFDDRRLPDDSAAPMRRFRRMPADSLPPRPRLRRPPTDSTR